MPILIADIGGTNARFALASSTPPYLECIATYFCKDHESLSAALDSYLAEHPIAPEAICIAAAGPLANKQIKLTNNHWLIDEAELANRYSCSRVILMNDFAAIAQSVPLLKAKDLVAIGGSWMPPENNFQVAIIGPGSGLGVAGLRYFNGKSTPLVTEAGHSGFAPASQQQIEIAKVLMKKYPRLSNEHLLSGPGLVNLYTALAQIQAVEALPCNAAQIARNGTQRKDSLSEQSMQLYFEILGQVAGDVALTLGGFDGVFIAGGITRRYIDNLKRSQFRTAFENKGDYARLMHNIPVWLIDHPNPGLLGASARGRQSIA